MFEQQCSAAVRTTGLVHCVDPVQVARCRSRPGLHSSKASQQPASGREQGLHYTTAEGSSAWAYIRELVNAAPAPPVRSWLDSDNFDARLSTVESIYRDRGARYPSKPWHDDSYRRCEYSVDWESGEWDVAC